MDPQERYTVKRRLEQSGVCVVYEGFDKQLQRKVAIKRLQSDDESGKDYEDLMRECQSLSALASANIVSLHDVGRDEDGPFMVLELLEGDSLQKILDEGPVELEDFYQVAEQTLEGLMAAHDIHLIHRDLKPSNINVLRRPSGRLLVKLQDFGLAKFSLEPSIRTIAHSNTLFGSIYYMAPEQFERQPLDARTDIYSLGAVFYHMLSGEFPYDGDSGAQVMIGAMNGGATDLAELRPDLDPALCKWIMSMIAKDPNDRPAGCSEALEQLAAIRQGKAAPATPAAAGLPIANIPEATPTPQPTPVPTPAPTPQPHPQHAATAAAPAPEPGPLPVAAQLPTAQEVAPAAQAPSQPAPTDLYAPAPSGPSSAPISTAMPPQQPLPAGVPAQSQQMMSQAQGAIPAPSPTVQMITGGGAPRPMATGPMVGAGGMNTGGTPAPRITGPIGGGPAMGQIGGSALMTGAQRPGAPLPKGSSFAAKQGGSTWWIWLVGAAAAMVVVFFVLQASPGTESPTLPGGGKIIPAGSANGGSNPAPAVEDEPQTLAEQLGLPKGNPEVVFTERDTNGDYSLSREEFVLAPTEAGRRDLEDAFVILDKNQNGKLALSELYRAYRKPKTSF